jgi:hypothetical protein
MNPITLLVMCQLLTGNTLAQDLPLAGLIEKTETTINAVRVERLGSAKACFIFLFEEKGALEVYDMKSNVVLKQPPAQGYVYWKDGFLHYDKLYCFAPDWTAIDFSGSSPVPRRITSTQPDVRVYKEFLGFEDGGKELLLADSRTGIDVFSIPDLSLIARISRDEPTKWRDDCLELSGNMVFYSNKTNEVAGYDIVTKKVIWRVNAGSKSPKFLGISMGTVSNSFLHTALNPHDGILYANTIFGDLYKIRPSDGSIVFRKAEFRGSGNNAGLLTRLYFEDLSGDGKPELVAASVDNNIYCMNTDDFSTVWEYDTGNEVQMPLAFRDLTGDGIPDVFAICDYDLKLSIIDGAKGTMVYETEFEKGKKFSQTYPSIADCGNGTPLRMVVQTGWRTIRVFDLAGVAAGANLK